MAKNIIKPKGLAIQIGDRIKELRLNKGLSQEKFADKIGLTRANLTQIELGNQLPTIPTLQEIVRIFNTTYNAVIDGIEARMDMVLEPIHAYGYIRKIPVVEHKARAGFKLSEFTDPEYIEAKPYISISSLPPGDYLAFEVYGDSMEPTFIQGDIVVGERMELQDLSARDDIYILLLRDNLVIKRVHYKRGDTELILSSDNDYVPSEKVNMKQVKAVWKYRPPIIRYKTNGDTDVDTRISNLEKDIKEIQKLLKK